MNPMQIRFYCGAVGTVVILLSSLPVHAATVEVSIDKLVFRPAEIIAAVGDTIEWTNHDVMVHTATADGGFDVLIPPHKSASTIVTTAGTLDYYCRFHPNMRGRIEIHAK
jgi:plastocyanin